MGKSFWLFLIYRLAATRKHSLAKRVPLRMIYFLIPNSKRIGKRFNIIAALRITVDKKINFFYYYSQRHIPVNSEKFMEILNDIFGTHIWAYVFFSLIRKKVKFYLLYFISNLPHCSFRVLLCSLHFIKLILFKYYTMVFQFEQKTV